MSCSTEFRLSDLRSNLWSMFGLPPSSTDAELVQAVRRAFRSRERLWQALDDMAAHIDQGGNAEALLAELGRMVGEARSNER